MGNSVLRSASRALFRVLALSAFLTLALVSAALADDVTNRIDNNVDATLENITLNEGASQSVALGVIGRGGDGEAGGLCNIDAGEQLVAAFSSSDTSVATPNPQTLTFTGCGLDQSTTVTAGARGTATVTAAEQSNTTGTGTYHYAPASFTVTVNNVAPTISNIADETTNEDTPTAVIPFTVGDAGTQAADLTVTGSSSNTTLVPNDKITIGGSGANRTVKVTPAADQSGTATIAVSVSDDVASTTDTFVLTVNAVNDGPPVISSVTNSGPVGEVSPATITVSATDVDGDTLYYEFDCNNDSAYDVDSQVSNNAQCTFNDDGTQRVNVQVSDGNGGTATHFTDVTANNVAPNAVNDSAGAQKGGSNVVIDVLANDTDVSGDALTIASNTEPPSAEGSVSCSASDCTFTPDALFSGTTNFTYTISDGDGGTDIATVTVNVVNDKPALDLNGGASGIDYSATFNEDGGSVSIVASGALSVADVDDANMEAATVKITNLKNGVDESLAANTGGTTISANYNSVTGELSLSGTAPKTVYQQVLRTVTYDNASQNPDITDRSVTFVVNDGDINSDVATSTVTVGVVNDTPVNSVPGAQSTDEDTALVFSAANGNRGSTSDDAAASNPVKVTLEATNGTLTLGGTAGLSFTTGTGTSDATMTFTGTRSDVNAALDGLSFDPAADYNGAATLTITTDDQGNTGTGGAKSDIDTVSITVNAVNDTPRISAVANQVTNEDVPTGAISFTVGDSETPAGALKVWAGSSNTTLVPNTNIVFDRSGATPTVTIKPAADRSGWAMITLSVSDDENAQATESFVLTVNAVVPTVTGAPTGLKVSPTSRVRATFSERMNEASVERKGVFKLMQGTTTVRARVDYNPVTRTATLFPTKKLRSGATYTAIVLGGAKGCKDLGGDSLASTKKWKFRVR